MKIRTWLFFAAFFWLIGAPVSPLCAGEKQALSQQTYKALIAAQELLEAGHNAKAVTSLKALLAGMDEKPYEQAVVFQTLAHAHIAEEDYSAAIPFLKRSLDLDVLPADAQQRTRYNLAQLYMATEHFSETIEQLKVWLAQADKPQAEAYVMMGSAYLQLKRYQDAINPLRKAIALSPAPKENWYQSLLGAHSELKQYKPCAELLHTMVRLFPERASYWRQLAGIQMLREKYPDALAVMELAYLRGHLESQRDLLNLAQLHMHRNAPYKAGVLIEYEIERGRLEKTAKNWEQAAMAWSQAKEMERAIKALEHVVSMSTDFEPSLGLAQLYLETEQWEKAAGRLQQALKIKKLKDDQAGQAWLLLGMAQMKRDLTEAASDAFEKAAKFSKTKNDAAQWLSYIKHGR